MSYPVLFSIIGAITGLIASQLSIHIHSPSINYFLFAHILLVANFSFIWKKQPTSTMIKSLVVMGAILFGLTAWFIWQDYHHTRRLSPLFIASLIQITVICTAFIQSWKPDKPHYVYSDLFENAWNNHFFLIFSGLLTAGFLLVLGLGTSLFDSIGIKVSNIIWSKEITPVIVATLVGAGIGISREYGSLIFKIRSVFFAIFRVMAYLAASIVILFTASLPFSVNTLFDNRNTSFILLSVVAISILLLNTLVDTSKDKDAEKLPVWKNRIFSAQIILLPFLSLLSVYAISLRILQYGLMPKRVIAITIAVLLSIYSLAYLYQLIKRKGHWTNGLAKINPPLAGLWVAMLIALSSPLIDPVRLSVNNQVERLQTSKVTPDQFDFYALKYRLGKRGEVAIKDMRSWKDHPQFALIEKHLDSSLPHHRAKKKLSITVIGEPLPKLEEITSHYKKWRCNTQTPCFIKKMKVSSEDKFEAVVFIFEGALDRHYKRLIADLYEYDTKTAILSNTGETSGRWYKVNTFRMEQKKPVIHINMNHTNNKAQSLEQARAELDAKYISKNKMKKIIEELKQDKQKLIQPKYYNIEIDGLRLLQ